MFYCHCLQHFHNKSCQGELQAGHATTTWYSLVTFQLDFCYLAEICEVEMCARRCGADTPTLSLSSKQTVFIHLGGPNRLCLSFGCVMRRRCDMLPWKRGGMPLAVALGAFHHIQRNNKHNNAGGEREYFIKNKKRRIRLPLN